ncbi:hypothetical protein V2I01_12315 [Micromonospora sp. BRA006-A]|nr:hypothetical protein [Micromonospora sp. BRA006-A]
MDAATEALPGADSGMSYRGAGAAADAARRPAAEFLAGLLQSDVGIAFLDRTRIRPVGFALGEHVYALALAPGEEAVLEQRTYTTKRELTLEEQNESEQQTDVELTSALTTELQEGFERQKSLTDTWGSTRATPASTPARPASGAPSTPATRSASPAASPRRARRRAAVP